MKRRSVFFFSPAASAFAIFAAAILLPAVAVHAQGAPKAGGSTSGSGGGGKPSGSGGTTPSSNNAGGSSVSPSDRPKTDPVPSPAPSSPSSNPIVIVNPSPSYSPTYVTPVTPLYNPTPLYSNAPVTIIKEQPPRERVTTPPAVPAPAAGNGALLFQVIQQKGGMTRYLIVDAQSKTVSIIKVRLPATEDGTAEVELESATPYGVKKP